MHGGQVAQVPHTLPHCDNALNLRPFRIPLDGTPCPHCAVLLPMVAYCPTESFRAHKSRSETTTPAFVFTRPRGGYLAFSSTARAMQ